MYAFRKLAGSTKILRCLSTEAVNHVPPKKLHGITGRYAGAIYTAASKVIRSFFDLFLSVTYHRKASLLSTVEEELHAFSTTLKKSPNFSAFILNPTIPRGEKTVKVCLKLESASTIAFKIYKSARRIAGG